MITFNKQSDNMIQIYGTCENGVKINGVALKTRVSGNKKKVWQYNVKCSKHPVMIHSISNVNEGTITSEDILYQRIEALCYAVEFNK